MILMVVESSELAVVHILLCGQVGLIEKPKFRRVRWSSRFQGIVGGLVHIDPVYLQSLGQRPVAVIIIYVSLGCLNYPQIDLFEAVDHGVRMRRYD